MDTGSVVALIVANLVTVIAIVASVFQNKRTLAQERRLSDLDSVRGLLTDAALALDEGEDALDGVRTNLVSHGPELFSDPQYRKPYEDLGALDKVTDRLLAQLRIRLGRSHRAVLGFALAAGAMKMTLVSFSNLEREIVGLDHEKAGLQRLRVLADVERDRKTFDREVEKFFSAGHIAAGAQLPA